MSDDDSLLFSSLLSINHGAALLILNADNWLPPLLDALIAKNSYIVSRLRGNDEISGTPVNLAEVSSPTWTCFRPLSYEEADEAWS